MNATRWALAIVAGLLLGAGGVHPRWSSPKPAPDAKEPAPPLVHAPDLPRLSLRIRLMTGQNSVRVAATGALSVTSGQQTRVLPAGAWSIVPLRTVPARQRFSLFIKTFKPSELADADTFVRQWNTQGYPAGLVPMGRSFTTTTASQTLDNQIYWVSVGAYPTLAAAEKAQHALEAKSQWGWIQAVTVQPGSGLAAIRDAAGKTACQVPIPFTLTASTPIAVKDVDHGFNKVQLDNRTYSGALEIAVDANGQLELVETVSLEDYVAGVLPAEMPGSWPAEALKAQAVAARSDTLAALGLKHTLEGFDFCATEHCRSYSGRSGRLPATDQAVAATAGEVLTDSARVVPTVFSANCGGWTENNENIWSSPPDPVLRGVSDREGGKESPLQLGIEKWLTSAPSAYCQADAKNYRWTRSMTGAELTALVNKKYSVGQVRQIEMGDRGVSGRLKWVKIVGTKGSELVRKELPIRLALGGLPSALFVVHKEPAAGGAMRFVFIGGGRGHGAGLCQQGARGMALQGVPYCAILAHYFSGVAIERVR